MKRNELSDFLNQVLNVASFSDYGPNGLQVEGRAEINKIVTAVSASVELFEKAIECHADAIIVHHGIIWNFERPVYKGGYKQRVKRLLENDLNLFAYHLPGCWVLKIPNLLVNIRAVTLESKGQDHR